MKKLMWFAPAVVALAIASCSNVNSLYPVSGTVTYGGQPAAGATVFFHRRGADRMNEHTIMGIVQEDGSFAIVCGSLGTGAPVGEYGVSIEWKHDLKQAKGLAHKGRDRLKGRYADPNHPLLRAVVKPESNCLPPFELMD